jgi:hypothetical protein
MHTMSSSLCALQKRLDAFEPVFLMAGLSTEQIYHKMEMAVGRLENKASEFRRESVDNGTKWYFRFGEDLFEVTLNKDCTYAISGSNNGQLKPAVVNESSFNFFTATLLAKCKRTDIQMPPLLDSQKR